MAIGKKSPATGSEKRAGVVNVITGNTISRDALSGHFVVVKKSGAGVSATKGTSKGTKTSTSAKKEEGSFVVNKKKAERAEQAVLSFLNKASK